MIKVGSVAATSLAPRGAPDDDGDPVRLPIHRVGWMGWAAALVGLAGVVLAAIVAQRPAPTRRPTPPVAVPAPAVVVPPPAVVVPPPAIVVPAPGVVGAPAVGAMPPIVAPAAPRLVPRRSHAPREVGGRIPIE